MNIKIKNPLCRCEGEAQSNLLFDGNIDLLRKFHQLKGNCVAMAPRSRFVATNASRNDVNVSEVAL